MSRQPHHTTPPLAEQLTHLIEDDWDEVLARLPSDYEQQAEHLQAFVRSREVRRVGDLLRALLAYVLCVSSLRQLSCWAVLIGLCNISEAAWRKRLRRSLAWLLWLLAALLAGPSVPELPAGRAGRGRVLLIDATRLGVPGGTGDDWRLHTAYDLRAGRLVQVSLSDRHGAESLQRFVLQPGDITVADEGYGYRVCVVWGLAQHADTVVRIHPNTFPLLDANGQPLDVLAWLRQLKSGQHSRSVRFVWQGQTYHVRLIARSLSPEATRRAQEAKRKQASRKQRPLSEDSLMLAGWILLITTLSAAQWSDAQVLALYRARWQVELVYKRMKQVLRLNHLRHKSPEANEATILALLVAWALQEQEVQHARALLEQAAAELSTPQEALPPSEPAMPTQALPPVSSWLLTAVCLHTLRQVTQGYWNLARLYECLPSLQRFLRGSPRRRPQQEQLMRLLLTDLLGPAPCWHPPSVSCSSA